jgi:thioester reductase-like protein
MINNYYKGKTILLTGATGFLGKVVLWKIFNALPDIKRLFVLVRPKKGMHVMDRVKKEIFQSLCFDNFRSNANFEAMIAEKIIPIEGDITKDNMAIKPEDRERMIQELDVIINCAASVDFNERLCDAIQINYFGCLRMLDLAHQC